MQLEIPKRLSLATQIAGSIRQGIERKVWTDYLPGERRLAEIYHVSRPTIGTALHVLAKEGVITIRHGHRNRIVKRGSHPIDRARVVAIITHEPLAMMAPQSLYSVIEMRAHLAEQGFLTEVFVCLPNGGAGQRRKLERFLQETEVVCCVLVSLRRELQQWFAQQKQPALVLGSCHASVSLPSLDIDYRSVCRHAAGTFLARGHRTLALVIPDSGGAGELASEAGVLEAVQSHGQKDSVGLVIRHNGTARSLGDRLDSVFASPRPPTALLVAKSQHVFAVVIYLLKRGLTVPGKVSLIARDADNAFPNVSPTIAHYSARDGAFNRRLSQLILQLASQHALPNRPNLIFPKYIPGESVRSLR